MTASPTTSGLASRRPAKPRRSALPAIGIIGALALTIASARLVGFDPGEFLRNWDRGLGILGEILDVDWAFFPETVDPLIVTIQMAIIASLLGCAVALPLAFVASRVTAPGRRSMAIDRAVLNVIRALPDLLYAMIFVAALSIGPTAGILALIVFNVGVMAKLLSETVDAVEVGPMEAAQAAGASHTQVVRTSILPQVLPNYVAFALYIFELNIRASTVIGLVGAGGIGFLLSIQMAAFNYGNVGLIIVELFVLVLVIELVSNALRRRLV
jgi:phosphonate transport system permease protein